VTNDVFAILIIILTGRSVIHSGRINNARLVTSTTVAAAAADDENVI